MRLILQLALLSLGFASTSVAHAETPNPWTDCGIGALIFGGLEDDTASAVLSAISNITWDLGTTGTTSATITPETCKGADVSAAIFIQQNLRLVEEQVVSGKGDHVIAVLELYQCSHNDRSDILDAIRTDIQPVFTNPNYSTATKTEQAEAIWNVFNGSIQTSEKCAV